jgi:hypothetical protein
VRFAPRQPSWAILSAVRAPASMSQNALPAIGNAHRRAKDREWKVARSRMSRWLCTTSRTSVWRTPSPPTPWCAWISAAPTCFQCSAGQGRILLDGRWQLCPRWLGLPRAASRVARV